MVNVSAGSDQNTTVNTLYRKMSEVTSVDKNAQKFCLWKSAANRQVKDKCLAINTSPCPNLHPLKLPIHHRLRQMSCPTQGTQRRLLYECPRCHRFRNFLDDRDKFILYGVTRLWPTPPPAPPAVSSPSPQLGDATSSSSNCLEGTYNISRIFHTRKAKLNPKGSQRKKNTVTPSPALAQTSNKQRIPSTDSSLRESSFKSYSNHINSGNNDLVQMVELLRRCVTPRDHLILKRSMSASSNFSTAISCQPATSMAASSSSTRRKGARAFERKNADGKSVRGTSSLSAFPAKVNSLQLISPVRLETWATRLHCRSFLDKTDWVLLGTGKNQRSAKSSDSVQRKKKRKKKKSHSWKQKNCRVKSTEKSQTSSAVNPGAEIASDIIYGSAVLSSKAGIDSHGVEKLGNVTDTSSTSEALNKTERVCVRARARARSLSIHHSPAVGELTATSNVIANIEAVKIGEENTTHVKKQVSRRLQRKRSTGSANIIDSDGTPDTPDNESSFHVRNVKPCYSPRDPMTLLKEFKMRMRKCQGKGCIKPSNVQVTAYMEGRKLETKFQTLPKTYQQMGLAPLARSSSSENCSQVTKVTGTVSETEAVPKVEGHIRRKKKKKKKKCDKSTTESEDMKVTNVNHQVKTSTTSMKQKSHLHRQSATALPATSTISTSTT